MVTLNILQEIDQLCDEWEPEPLFETIKPTKVEYEAPVISRYRVTEPAYCLIPSMMSAEHLALGIWCQFDSRVAERH